MILLSTLIRDLSIGFHTLCGHWVSPGRSNDLEEGRIVSVYLCSCGKEWPTLNDSFAPEEFRWKNF